MFYSVPYPHASQVWGPVWQVGKERGGGQSSPLTKQDQVRLTGGWGALGKKANILYLHLSWGCWGAEQTWTLLNTIEHCWTLLNTSEYYWTLLKTFEHYWTPLNTIKHFWILLRVLRRTSGGTSLLQMIICHSCHPSHLCQDPDSTSLTFLEQLVLVSSPNQ